MVTRILAERLSNEGYPHAAVGFMAGGQLCVSVLRREAQA